MSSLGPRAWLRLVGAAAALVLALGACSDDDGAAPATSSTTEAPAEADGGSTGSGGADPTTTLPDAAESVELRGDGLGVVALGDEPEAAIAALSEALGAPTGDSGWTPAFSEYGTCPGEQIRGVSWDHLVVLFTDGETEHGSGQHLFSWRITGAPPALGTATGFGWGATAADAEELYPGAVEVVPAEEPFPGFLVVETDSGTITAFLDESDVVTNLEAGTPCGE